MNLITWMVLLSLLTGGGFFGLREFQQHQQEALIQSILHSTEIDDGDFSTHFHGPSLMFGAGERARTRYRITDPTAHPAFNEDLRQSLEGKIRKYVSEGWRYQGRDAEWLYFHRPQHS